MCATALWGQVRGKAGIQKVEIKSWARSTSEHAHLSLMYLSLVHFEAKCPL